METSVSHIAWWRESVKIIKIVIVITILEFVISNE